MTVMRLGPFYALIWSIFLGGGCSDDALNGSLKDCSTDDIGCSLGLVCVLMEDDRHRCMSEDVHLDATVPTFDATIPTFDATMAMPDARVDIFDALLPQDAELAADGDDDGIEDLLDNCPDTPNVDQIDEDNDGLGDPCDTDPNVQNFILNGQVLILGGSSIDDRYTIKSKVTTAAGELTDGQLIMMGELKL